MSALTMSFASVDSGALAGELWAGDVPQRGHQLVRPCLALNACLQSGVCDRHVVVQTRWLSTAVCCSLSS